MRDETLQDETTLRWSFLENEPDPCLVVSEKMELVYVNTPARSLVPEQWFGKRCFEVLPTADEACAFHCPKIDAVHEATAPQVVYCEEVLYQSNLSRLVLGVGLIPLGAKASDYARAVFLLREKDEAGDAKAFETKLLEDAQGLRDRVSAHVASS